MALDSYKLTREYISSNPRKEMLRHKKQQINGLYALAADREDNTLLNGKEFVESPRIFDRKAVDTVHDKITVVTVNDEDYIECGDYMEFEGRQWLCLRAYSFHNLYCSATFHSCDWKIYWVNKNGEIKSQHVIDENSTQYNSGEASVLQMTLGSTQHMLRMQCNEDTLPIDSPMRFVIDRNIENPTCYKVTQNDNTTYNYGKGLCCITVVEDRIDYTTDKLVTLDDGTQVWICDYYKIDASSNLEDILSNTDEERTVQAVISGNPKLKIGYSKTYTLKITDEDGNDITSDTEFSWSVISDFSVEQNINENKITVQVNDEDYIERSFTVQAVDSNGDFLAEIRVTVTDVV